MRNKGNEEAEQRKRRSRPKKTRKQTEENEEAGRRERERRLLETKKRNAGNKKADRCGLGSGPLKTGGGIGDEGRGAAGGG